MCLNGNQNKLIFLENSRNKFLFLKLIGLIILLILTIFNMIYGLSLNSSNLTKNQKIIQENFFINDISFLVSENINIKLSDSKFLRAIILNSTYFVFNIYIVIFCYIWVKYSKTWRVIIALILYLILRTFLMAIVNTRDYPSKAHDQSFLFPLFTSFKIISVHFNLPLSLAFLTIVTLELKRMKNANLVLFGYFTLILLSVKNLVFRDENTADIIIALLISHYLFLISDIYSFYLDNTCLRLEDEISMFSLEEEYLI